MFSFFYIIISKECIKPVEVAKKSKTGSKITIQDDGTMTETTSVSILKFN